MTEQKDSSLPEKNIAGIKQEDITNEPNSAENKANQSVSKETPINNFDISIDKNKALNEKLAQIESIFGEKHQHLWNSEDDKLLIGEVTEQKISDDEEKDTSGWQAVAELFKGRKTVEECYNRYTRILSKQLGEKQNSVKKGTWSKEEDSLLVRLIRAAPFKHWGAVSSLMPGRSAKQCRERWCYSLDPSINKGDWTDKEDNILLLQQKKLGNRWAYIASLLKGRTENAVKTRYKSLMRAKLRAWLPEEDKEIIRMHRKIGSKWDKIAEKFPKRTKNAVRTRYRELVKEAARLGKTQEELVGCEPEASLDVGRGWIGNQQFSTSRKRQRGLLGNEQDLAFPNALFANAIPRSQLFIGHPSQYVYNPGESDSGLPHKSLRPNLQTKTPWTWPMNQNLRVVAPQNYQQGSQLSSMSLPHQVIMPQQPLQQYIMPPSSDYAMQGIHPY